MGMATLIASPVVIATLNAPVAAPAANLASARVTPIVEHSEGTLPRTVPELRAPEPTPTPTPVPTPEPTAEATVEATAAPVMAPPPVAADGSIDAIIIAAAQRYGVDPNWMLAIASCESGRNPQSVNPNGYYGLFQFSPSTFANNGGTDIWSAEQQADITARMLANGQAHQWSCA